jgi:hypothetical protein
MDLEGEEEEEEDEEGFVHGWGKSGFKTSMPQQTQLTQNFRTHSQILVTPL